MQRDLDRAASRPSPFARAVGGFAANYGAEGRPFGGGVGGLTGRLSGGSPEGREVFGRRCDRWALGNIRGEARRWRLVDVKLLPLLWSAAPLAWHSLHLPPSLGGLCYSGTCGTASPRSPASNGPRGAGCTGGGGGGESGGGGGGESGGGGGGEAACGLGEHAQPPPLLALLVWGDGALRAWAEEY